jgi:hypothetical protein
LAIGGPATTIDLAISATDLDLPLRDLATVDMATADLPSGTVIFNHVGAPQSYAVPAGVTHILVDVRGAQGGGAPGLGVSGGKGGRVESMVAVTPLETLQIEVGGAGGNAVFPNARAPGGYNGGGAGGIDTLDFNGPGTGGGGASDVRRGGNDLAHRVVVAGGGGGSEAFGAGPGGAGMSTTGGDGACSATVCTCASPGLGGAPTAGGAGGMGCHGPGSAGTSGGLGQGGAGGDGTHAGSGGGGGYYGGGGGGGCCLGAGGGAGSSYASGTNITYTSSFQTGHGQIIITPQ